MDYSKRLCDTLDEVRKLVLGKNMDYGDSMFKPPMLAPYLPADATILARLSDKMARLATLLSPGVSGTVADETVNDTIMDAIGYLVALKIVLEDDER